MLAAVIITVLLALTAWIVYWWLSQPRTPAELFRVRCSSCHELRTAKICVFDPQLRAAIVGTMRQLHGAGKVISDDEARLIRRYLEESLPCP